MSQSQRKESYKTSISYDTGTYRKSKSKDLSAKQKTILQPPKHGPPVRIMFEETDVTPLPLNPYVYEGSKERQISVLDSLTRETSFMVHRVSISKMDTQKFQVNLMQQKFEGDTTFFNNQRSYITSAFADELFVPGMGSISSRGESERTFSLFSEKSEASVPEKAVEIPRHISLTLKETETMFLIDLPSCFVIKGTEEGYIVEDDNKMYEFLTKGKGRNRKVFSVGIQTVPILTKSRDTKTKKVKYKNRSTFVSSWEMYDTYQKEQVIDSENEEELVSEHDSDTDDIHQLNDETSLVSYRMSMEEKELNKIVNSKAFLDALIVMERILSSNCYNEQQKRFKGLSDPYCLREKVEYKYRLKLLWTYSNDDTQSRCVTAVAFNSFNEDILAVAYGKYYYNDRDCTGMVMIWNIKNPQQPERQYNFTHPVTSIAFSKLDPNLLAVGFYNGDLYIMDVSKRESDPVKKSAKVSFEPAWSIVWFQQSQEEDLMVGFGDGKVFRYQLTISQLLRCTQIMITPAAEGKLKGITFLQKCENKDISITRYEGARYLVMHPSDPFIYFVGTSEGVIHRCSTNYYNEHMDLFKAHDGAVQTIRFCPFANKLYMTCGDDFKTCLWVDGIQEPLLSSESSVMPILATDWSTSHATVIASVRGADIMVWDMQRKIHMPQSCTRSPTNSFNTVCRFTSNGRCLIVGDMAGNVHVFSLEDMPFPPFFAEDLLVQSLKKLLVTRPETLKKLRKLGSLNFEKKRKSKYFY